MTYQLTYADRELLLQAFDSLKTQINKTDEQIITTVSHWAKQLIPHFGFELSLIRDITVLSRYLVSHSSEHDIKDIATGALIYVIQSSRTGATRFGELRLLNDAFICNYAVHEIRTRLNEQATYNPPRLTKDEMNWAESLFLEFVDAPVFDDLSLIEKSRSIAEELENFVTCGLFQRFRKNIEFLSSVLVDSSRDPDKKSYARAALNYVICEDDAINDNIGIIGYLDDNFIVQLAVDFIEPDREPWIELLDEIVRIRPFINNLVINDGDGGRPVSEYMIINSALTCDKLHGEEFPKSIMMILPDIGLTPFLLGFISVLGLIYEANQQEVKEDSFTPGQKVIVDNNTIAEFAGFIFINNRKMFGLTQYPVKDGQCQPCTYYWPISDLGRIIPADSSRAIRGQLTYDKSLTDIPIPALDCLFGDVKTVPISTVKKRIVVVMPAAAAHDISCQLSLYGYSLKDVIPMGHLTSEEQTKRWSNRFGEADPLLTVIHDLDSACAYVEENSDKIHKVIIDATGRNAKKRASLIRLHQLGIPMLVVSPERDADDLGLINTDNVGVWEWEDNEFSSLLWPTQYMVSHKGPLSRHERWLQSLPSSSPEIINISLLAAEEAFKAVQKVRSFVKKRGDEQLVELKDIMVLAFGVMSRLLRSAFPLSEDTHSSEEIAASLNKLNEIRQRSRYLTEEEKKAIAETEHTLYKLYFELQCNNPKTKIMREMVVKDPNLAVICPDARFGTDLKHISHMFGVRTTIDHMGINGDLEGAIIPGWFRKDRMASLLTPPITKPLYLLLYEIEQKWYIDFQNELQKTRRKRSASISRSKLFPGIKGWRTQKQEPPESVNLDNTVGLQEIEAIQDDLYSIYRQRIYDTTRSDGSEEEVPARLVIFEGGFYAFLTEFYKANTVTHLIDASIEELEDKADVKQKAVLQLKLGDALLFHRGSDKDVIRTAADKILAPDIRKTSSLWRIALLLYVLRENLTYESVWRKLQEGGCPLTYPTIKSWLDNDNIIAPQSYERDIKIIAKVTGDKILLNRVQEVLNSIKAVRSAHIRVSRQLAKQVLRRAVNILKEERLSSLVEIESNVVCVRIAEIDDQPTPVRTSFINRLMEGEQWHE